MTIPSQLKLAMIGAAAVLAAAANQRYLTESTREEEFVAVRYDIEAGDKIQFPDLKPVSLGGDLAAANQTLLPWSQRAQVRDLPARRNLSAGDLVLRTDVEWSASGPFVFSAREFVFSAPMESLRGLASSVAIGDVVQFLIAREMLNGDPPQVEICGPFTVQALDKFLRQLDSDGTRRPRPKSITLSTPKNPDGSRPELVGRLLEALAGGQSIRIVAIEHVQPNR